MKLRKISGNGFRNSPWPKGCAVKAGIVNHNRHAVRGEANVSLYTVSQSTEGHIEGRQRILRCLT
jgi:hypothetical protein